MDDESTFEICEEDEVVFLSDDDVVTRRPPVNSEDEDYEEEDFDPSKKTSNMISLLLKWHVSEPGKQSKAHMFRCKIG